jgi:hypothetical protein
MNVKVHMWVWRGPALIGRGGMSVVWRGTDTVLGRQVAVKVLAGASGARQIYRGSIRTDATAAASLSHHNVAAVFDYGEHTTDSGETIPYVVMELLLGLPLSQRLKDGPLEPALAFRICAQVAAALATAHANGLVRRDIKPANVMLTPGGAKVIDFGIAAPVGQLNDLDAGVPVLGTPAYLAPERLADGSVTAASDVYALGLLLFRTLTNELPWPAETVTEMIAAHAYTDPSPLPDLPGVPAAVRELVVACLAKQPQDRPSAGSAAIILADAAMIEPPMSEDQLSVAARYHLPSARPAAPEPAAGSDRVASNRAALADVQLDATGPTSATRVARRRRWPVATIAAAILVTSAILIAPVLIPALSSRTPVRASGKADLEAAGATQLVHSDGPVATDPATGTPDPYRDPTTPTVVTTAGIPAATGVPPTTTTTSTATTPPPQTFDTDGGTVTAACRGTLAALTSWAPKPSYTVKKVEAGPATVARILFQSMAERREVATRLTCKTGMPVASTMATSIP